MEKKSPQQVVVGKLESHMQINMNTPSHHTQKNFKIA